MALAAMAPLLTACDSDDPLALSPAAFDAAAVVAGLDAVEGPRLTEGWVSFAHLARAFQVPAAPLAPGPISGDAAVPIVPPTALGRTFVHDGEGYVVDEGREGAPADGVRFVLYAIDEQTSAPHLGVELGHADIRDVGAAIENGFEFAIEAVTMSAGTLLDYMVSFDLDEGAASASDARSFDHDGIELIGHVSDGLGELSFGIVTGMVNGLEVVDLDLWAGAASVVGLIGHDESTGIVDVDVSLLIGGEELRIVGSGAGSGFAATISSNASPLASAAAWSRSGSSRRRGSSSAPSRSRRSVAS